MTTHEQFESIAAMDAIGAATADEEHALRAHLRECVPCRRARDEYAEAVTLLARDLAPVEPPGDLRERIGDSVAPAIPARETRISPWWLATAATIFLALWGWREFSIRVMREHTTSQKAEIDQLRTRIDQLNSQNEKLSSVLASTETRTIALTGQEVAPAASAKVFLVPNHRRALVFFNDLPANPGDKSYQLWIIRADQPKPVSAGIFDVDATGKASISIENLPLSTEIKALAVTLEPRGGVEQPTNTRFIVAGQT